MNNPLFYMAARLCYYLPFLQLYCKRMRIAPLLLALALAPAAAQESTEPTVEVSSVRDPAFKSYRLMLRGVESFEQNRALSPQGVLRFQLLPDQGVAAKGLELRIVGDSSVIPVPLDEQLTFALPRDAAAAADDADLRTNRKRGAVRWAPDIRTPGLPQGMRRLGDVRAECKVFWTIGREDSSLLLRVMFSATSDPCNSRSASWLEETIQPLASAQLHEGERVLALKIAKNGLGYDVPLRDKGWSDEAMIELRYLNTAQP